MPCFRHTLGNSRIHSQEDLPWERVPGDEIFVNLQASAEAPNFVLKEFSERLKKLNYSQYFFSSPSPQQAGEEGGRARLGLFGWMLVALKDRGSGSVLEMEKCQPTRRPCCYRQGQLNYGTY